MFPKDLAFDHDFCGDARQKFQPVGRKACQKRLKRARAPACLPMKIKTGGQGGWQPACCDVHMLHAAQSGAE
jgi:hypothetical protein